MEFFHLGITQSLERKCLATARVADARGFRRRIVAAALAAMAPLTASWQAEAAGRVALVIVGEHYLKLGQSSIGTRRANAIAEALQAKGFDVLLGADTVNSRTRAILLDFAQKANGADLAVAFLIGHVTAAGGQSYFLPVNTELSVATDLFSRGIAIASVAQIVSKAGAGAVIVLMTKPNFEPAVPGLDTRPEYATENPTSVVTVFSSSAKLPVSRIDAVSEQTADAIAKLLQQPAPSLKDVVKAASADVGAVFGASADVSLAKAVPPPENAAASGPPIRPATDSGAGSQRRPKEDSAQTEAAQLQLQQARTELERARLETQKAQAEASRASADAEKAKAEAQAEIARTQTGTSPGRAAVEAVSPIDEKLIGTAQRRRIQERLRDMSLYTGPINSVMGPLTREAIMGYQRSKGAPVTGYLTPQQFQALLPEGN